MPIQRDSSIVDILLRGQWTFDPTTRHHGAVFRSTSLASLGAFLFGPLRGLATESRHPRFTQPPPLLNPSSPPPLHFGGTFFAQQLPILPCTSHTLDACSCSSASRFAHPSQNKFTDPFPRYPQPCRYPVLISKPGTILSQCDDVTTRNDLKDPQHQFARLLLGSPLRRTSFDCSAFAASVCDCCIS